MDFRNQPEWLQLAQLIGVAVLTAGVGIMAKIADEVKRGERKRFWSRELWLELPAWMLAATLTVGSSVYFHLDGPVAGLLGAALGYLGPKIIDVIVAAKLR